MTRGALRCACLLTVALTACGPEGGAKQPTDVLPASYAGPRPSEIIVAPKADTLFALGQTTSFGAVVISRDKNALAGIAVSWASSVPDVFTVDPRSGTVTARSEGSGVVEAYAGPVSGRATVVVIQLPAALSLAASETALSIGDTLRLFAGVADANGYPVSGRILTWSSSEPTIVSVEEGLVRALRPGRATVRVELGELAATVAFMVSGAD